MKKLAAALFVLLAAWPALADPVTGWTRVADRAGQGAANWHTLAIMHQAMHDAWNAADPRYARWFPPEANEPALAAARPKGPAVSVTRPQAAMAAAARRVLLALNPEASAAIEAEYALAPPDPDGRALGDAIGAAAVARRNRDGYETRRPFAAGTGPGRWRPAPADFSTSNTTDTKPFLFTGLADAQPGPPPAIDSAAFRKLVDEVMRLGAGDSTTRTEAQTDAAFFWAYQSGQRGWVALAATLLETLPRPGSPAERLAAHARIMSLVTVAMADAAVLTWKEKEAFQFIRPIYVIRDTVPGEADWQPLIVTPPHPEHPSGHASDCYTGAYTLMAAMPDLKGPFTYTVQQGVPPADNVGMGQHGQARPDRKAPSRLFPTLDAAAQECADSRIYAGAHFRSANEESRRLARLIAARATAALPAVPAAR